MYQKDEPPEHLALKISDAYFQETQKTVGNRDSILKGQTQILSVVGTKEDGSKEPGSDPRPDLGESPREAGGNWSSH